YFSAMKRLPLISVCFFGCRAASTGGISDDIRGFTGHQHKKKLKVEVSRLLEIKYNLSWKYKD
ncbi:MAG: hypothetical protein PHX39_09935, partial [Bacteroidales bacterium]|nr:hypothetical protein [Bacteroidales bacterium]MDD4176269.1 hypothetical protein [Bacteroidales bacterium]